MPGVLHVLKWDQSRLRKLPGGVERRVITTQNIMIVQYIFPPGSVFPGHFHPQEQVTFVEKGRMEYEVEHVKHDLGPGDVITIPPNAHHRSRNSGEWAAITLNIFHPIVKEFVKEAQTD